MDFTKLFASVDSLTKNGIPIRIIFDEMSIVKIGIAVLAAVIIVAVFKKYVLG